MGHAASSLLGVSSESEGLLWGSALSGRPLHIELTAYEKHAEYGTFGLPSKMFAKSECKHLITSFNMLRTEEI